MKKWLLPTLLALFPLLSLPVGAAPKFFVKIIPSRAVNLEDQFTGILPERPPTIPTAYRVGCNEPFHVNICFGGAKIVDGKIALSGKITALDPNGKKTEIPCREELSAVTGDPSGVFLMRQMLKVVMEPQDPKGEYRFQVELTDRNSGVSVRDEAAVKYADPPAPQDGKKAFAALEQYYNSPAPECILPAFREYLNRLPQQKAREKHHYNPLPQLAIFYFLLQDNPQCVNPFAEMVRSLSGEAKFLGSVVLYFAAPDAAGFLNDDQKNAIKTQCPDNPFVIRDATQAWHLDVCWAEFLARGTKAPVMKVIAAMGLANGSLPIKQYKKIAKPTEEDNRKLLQGLTATAAVWSTRSLAQKHPLLRWYVEAALTRGEIKDPLVGVLAADAIGLKVKIKRKL